MFEVAIEVVHVARLIEIEVCHAIDVVCNFTV